jgi:hypothetical protein
MNIDDPVAILGITLFVLSAVASIFGPARWRTNKLKPKFAVIAGVLLLAGVAMYLFAQS